MKRIIDECLLLIYSFFTILLINMDISFIFSFLCAVIFVSICYFLNSKKMSIMVTLAYALISLLFPPLLLFFPALLYIMLQYQCHLALMLSGIGFVLYYPSHQAPLWFVMVFGAALAFFLQSKSTAYETLSVNYKQTRDDSTELNLLLTEKNQALLEKQDYEIYTATLKERNRIAREIHDNVGHMLSRALLMVGALKAMNTQEPLHEPLQALEGTLHSAMDSVRMSVHDLHDESVNLKEVIQGLINDFDFCPVVLDYDMGIHVPREVKYSFISIVKEALTNIVKHSNATKAYILLREHPALYQLAVEDNGTKSIANKDSGIGLVNLNERVNALKGHIQIRSEHGFRIFITIPKNNTDAFNENPIE